MDSHARAYSKNKSSKSKGVGWDGPVMHMGERDEEVRRERMGGE
jgi:hypothetical protein